MDAMNIALLGGGLMPGLGGTPSMPDISGNPADAESFGAVLGGMMGNTVNAETVPENDIPPVNDLIKGMSIAQARVKPSAVQNDASVPAAQDDSRSVIEGMDIIHAVERDFTFSPEAENALMNFISSYFGASAKNDLSGADGTVDTEQLLAGWQEMLSELGTADIAQLSAFSSELETALFSGSRYGSDITGNSDDIKWTAGDVFIEVLGNRTKKKNSSDSDIGMVLAQTIAASGYTGFNFSDLMNISTTGDLMGTYSERTVKSITASAMNAAFGEESARLDDIPQLGNTVPIFTDNAETTGMTDISEFEETDEISQAEGIPKQVLIDEVDSRNNTVIHDEPVENAPVLSPEERRAQFDNPVQIITASPEESVEDFSRLLSDAVRGYIEDNGIEISSVQPARAESAAPSESVTNGTPVIPVIPSQDFRVNDRIMFAPKEVNTADIPRIRFNDISVPAPVTENITNAENTAPAPQETAAPAEQTPVREIPQTPVPADEAPEQPVYNSAEVAVRNTPAVNNRTEEIAGRTESVGSAESAERDVRRREVPADVQLFSQAQVQPRMQGVTQTEHFVPAENAEDIPHSINVQTAEAVLERISDDPRTGDTEITVRLNPRSLGEITVKVARNETGDISVTLAAHDPMTARMLGEHSSELVQLLSERSGSQTNVNVVDPAQAGQYMDLDMGGSGAFYFGQGGSSGSNSGRTDGARYDGGEEVQSVGSAGEEEYISEEARLWTTA